VILMQQNFNDISALFPKVLDIDLVKQIKPTIPFDIESIGFLNLLSKELTSDLQIRAFPDVATFAFFCRKANILKIKEQYNGEDTIRIGRGLVFHIAPSNVPVNFAYSLVCGILAGNVNIVRVPSKDFDQIRIICEAISRIAKTNTYAAVTSRIILVRYDRLSNYTNLFSGLCDVRVIWGGDETIADVRKSYLPSRSFDVTFADRYSLCAINGDIYVAELNPEKIALGFYNDTYLFDQNACTSPHLIVWTGNEENVRKSKEIFWENLYQIVQQKQYMVSPVIAVDKLTSLFKHAIKSSGIKKMNTKSNVLWRINLNDLSENIDDYRCSSGYFLEFHANALSEISDIANRKFQTIAYYGYNKDELKSQIIDAKPYGIDRIVRIGSTTDFSIIWDGYDLIRTLSRCCEIY